VTPKSKVLGFSEISGIIYQWTHVTLNKTRIFSSSVVGTPSRFVALISLIFVISVPFLRPFVNCEFQFWFWILRAPFPGKEDSAAANEFGSPFGLERRVWSVLNPR